MATGSNPLGELWTLPLSSEEKRLLSVKLALLKLEGKDPSVFFMALDPEDRAGVLRNFLTESTPKIADEDAMDLTYRTISQFSTPVVPSLRDLSAFLLGKPDGLKILVSPRTYKRVREYDVQDLFAVSESDRCFTLEEHLTGCILPAPETGVTEFSFIQAWDNLINTPVRLFMTVPFKKDRNTNFNTGTTNSLPDVVGYVGGHWSLWLAEEKPEEVGDPREELVSKRKWCYRSIPYILGYYARGLRVTLLTLYPEGGEVKSRDLATFNLGQVSDRIKLFMVVFNVGRVLAGLHGICVSHGEGSEFEVVKIISSGKSVRLAGDRVLKGYQTSYRRMKIWKIYSQLKGCPNMETCLSKKPADEKADGSKRRKVDEYVLRFAPRLSRTARATTQESLVTALLHVSKALAWLKDNKWIHRDVHWRNVALNPATRVWTLIDADEACTFEAARTRHPLCAETHAPEMLTGPHGPAVDVWGLGYLIRSVRDVTVVDSQVDEGLWSLASDCTKADPEKRPSIGECVRVLKRCRKRLCAGKQKEETSES